MSFLTVKKAEIEEKSSNAQIRKEGPQSKVKVVARQVDQREKKDIVEIEVRGIDNKRSLDGPTDPLKNRSRAQNQLHIQSDYHTNPTSGFQSQKLTQKQSMQEFERALGIKD